MAQQSFYNNLRAPGPDARDPRIGDMRDMWFDNDASMENPYFQKYLNFFRNDWFYNKADIVKYRYVSAAKQAAYPDADFRARCLSNEFVDVGTGNSSMVSYG